MHKIQQRQLKTKITSLVILTLVGLINCSGVFCQGPVKTRLNYIHAKSVDLFSSPIAAMGNDTINLPFFEDFAYPGSAPDNRLWVDNNVYINNTFSAQQITQGIATFDHLDQFGTPYNFLSKFAYSGADTLTSQCINLKGDTSGRLYNLSDSIILSFFVQTGGLGDDPESGDSFKLEFFDNNGKWNLVWAITGNVAPDFTEYFVVIKDTKFLFNTFQFRFVNYVKNSGNMNHFHLDYIRLNEARSSTNDIIREIAFTKMPQQLLKNYAVMPYAHFMQNPGSQLASNRAVFFRNSGPVGSFVTLGTESFDNKGNSINSVPLSSSSNINVGAKSNGSFTYSNFTIPVMTGDTVFVKTTYIVQRGAIIDDKTQDDYSPLHNNNVIEKIQLFDEYYAYDDGSAESGYALDYGSLPNGPGYTAMRFDLEKIDTLRGIDIHFNRALEEVGNRPITLMFWQEIANGAGKSDQVICQIEAVPTYVNRKNGFARFLLDTVIILPKGEFYVGWKQNSDFIINVGFDENYRYQNQNVRNPNMYYNLIGTWDPMPSVGFEGALMMRPLIGKKVKDVVSVKPVSDGQLEVELYPNPSSASFTISSNHAVYYSIYDLTGKLIDQSLGSAKDFVVSINTKGMYICLITNKDNNSITTKKIVIE